VRSMTSSELHATTGWVTLQYEDGSQHVFETTFNPDILNSLVSPIYKDGHMLDINTGAWIELPAPTVAVATLTDEKPEQDEVNKFASKFIR